MLVANFEELKSLIAVSASFNYAKFEPYLLLAENKFLAKEIGDELIETLEAAKSGSDPIKLKALKFAQQAVARKAMGDYVPEGEVEFESNNIVRVESESSKSLFQYQRNALIDTMHGTAYEFLEELLKYAEKNAASDKLNWESASEYTRMARSIVPDASRFTEFVAVVNNSRWIYNRMKNSLSLKQNYIVKANCGQAMFDKLLTYNRTPLSEIPEYYMEAYQLACTALCYATWVEARYLFTEQADQRGLTKLAKSGSGQIVDSREAKTNDEIFAGMVSLQKLAEEYTGKFRFYLQKHADFLPEFKNSDKWKDPAAPKPPKEEGGVVGFL